MLQYLQSLLSESMLKKRRQIIQIFLSNQKASTQKFFIKEFENKNTYILICIDAVKMGVNI